MTALSPTLGVLLALALTDQGLSDLLREGGDTGAYVFRGSGHTVRLDPRTGALTCAGLPRGTTIWGTGEFGLWQIVFADGTRTSAAEVAERRGAITVEADQAQETVTIAYSDPEVRVLVTVAGIADGLELQGEITPLKAPILEFALPARLRFKPSQVTRFIFPEDGNKSVGTAFNSQFFGLQRRDQPVGWRSELAGAAGYVALLGGPLDQRADREPPVALRATEIACEWLPQSLVERINSSNAVVNRPSTRAQVDLVIADSENGPYFAASSLGGAGRLWRIGGAVGDAEVGLVADLVTAVAQRLARTATDTRTKLGLISLTNGPLQGGWAAVPVSEWRSRVSVVARAAGMRLVQLATPEDTLAAARTDDFLLILNPYGESVPVSKDGNLQTTVRAVHRYVTAGGNWFEVGGYPFFYAMRPLVYLDHSARYPPAFADFLHLDTVNGRASVYRVQPQAHQPWAGAEDLETIFVPGSLRCGGDEQGGYCDRFFATYVRPGQTWRAPIVRITIGNTAEQDLQAYCQANEIRRRLEDKMPPDKLERFKRSVLVYYAGSAREKLESLHLLPVPAQVHFADYLRGGFDKQYPDHLPPNPSFGTPDELREFFDRCRELGHLIMPYTNPTWWCDHPRGPTFERHGTDPLLKTLNGELSYECYGNNDGYTVCHWHPAVRAANAETRRLFTEEFPVDILFQDQCGARTWHYDTNPASPTPYAYTEGLLSMVAEDSQKVPLSTESGWDRVVNYESQLCGMSWSIVPTEGAPSWRTLMKERLPVKTWELYPLAQYIAHDKTAMLYHDLGQFVTNREVLTWAIGLGFCMSYRVGATDLQKDAPREWLRWVDRVQKSVCARYVGQPVAAFEHDRGPKPRAHHDGVIRAAYGPVRVIANLGAEPRGGLPPYGFRATAPGLVAGEVQDVKGRLTSFVAEASPEGAELWVYAPPDCEVQAELPEHVGSRPSVIVEDHKAVDARASGRQLSLRLPPRSSVPSVAPPPQLAGKAPQQWPNARPAIGIIDLGPQVHPTWTTIRPEDWIAAFRRSALTTEYGLPIVPITSTQELLRALDSGPTEWLAIVNPYGEQFPSGPDWRTTIARIQRYVNGGGCWWETAGYSFYVALSREGGQWRRTVIGHSGMGVLGLRAGGGEVDQAPEPLHISQAGREILGPRLSARVEGLASSVNRGLPRGADDPGHITLVGGSRQDFIGLYRLDGWGYLGRIGGLNPNPNVAVPVVVATIEYIYTHPPLPADCAGVRYLWHLTVLRR